VLLKPLPQARFGYKVLLAPYGTVRVGNYVQGPMGVNHWEPRPLVAVRNTISVIEMSLGIFMRFWRARNCSTSCYLRE
jgi:hypothetical protein